MSDSSWGSYLVQRKVPLVEYACRYDALLVGMAALAVPEAGVLTVIHTPG